MFSKLYRIKYDVKAKVYVSYTPVLNIYSQGITRDRAKEALRDAIASFLFVHFEYANGVRPCLT